MTPAEQQRLLDILDYWHKIEFFIPFDLGQVSDKQADDATCRWLAPAQLAQLPASFLARSKVAPELELSGFNLYLGVFDKAEIERATRAAQQAGAPDQLADTESGALEGRSCFARLQLNALGEPNFDPVSVSTAPWAIGRSAAHGLTSLGLDAWQHAQAGLQDALQNFRAARLARPGDDGLPNFALDGVEIGALAELLYDWAGFRPAAGQPVALLELKTIKKAEPKAAPAAEAQPELDLQAGSPPAIDILNSFYIADIERAIRAIRSGAGAAPAALAAYLTPLPAARRIDLYSEAGRRAMIELLHPARTNRGHWLEDAERTMSLMQQFALNAARAELETSGLFAVNGPPGTGKTTLLREIFADNIVRRAAVLARLEKAADAFGKKIKVSFNGDTRSTWIAPLRRELTGFEMVVASSNNAAVENISHDLPKRKQLGKAWSSAAYLHGVAYRLAAEGGDGKLRPLAPAEQPWGLISCALGRRAKRQHFVSKFYYEGKEKPAGAARHIRQWVEEYRGVSFEQASRLFHDAEQRVATASQELATYADLWAGAGQTTRDGFCAAALETLNQAGRDDAAAGLALAEAGAALAALLEERAALLEEERLLELAKPGWLARLFHTGAARRHRREVVSNAETQRSTARAISTRKTGIAGELEPLRARSAAALDAARAGYEASGRSWDRQQALLAECRLRFPTLKLPASLEQLEQRDFQVAGLWHDTALAHLRSCLFQKALALHEAWLAEVAQKGGAGFAANLFAVALLLDNKQPDDEAHAALIWHSLFMVVPVVSTTFASFARQFAGMGQESLGWLFIDEAGQAVPQAAVGALWRAKRAVVVGDPLQIEPVFNVPTAMVKALSALSPHTGDGAYAPNQVSVQRLADQANRYGTLSAAGGDASAPLWIGSPLRVHRRCAEPMFSLANQIAYDGKMVSGLAGLAPAAALGLGPSAWIELGGPARTRQAVPQQTELVAALVARLVARDGVLPDLYVISPFKAVAAEIRKRLLGPDWAAGMRQPPSRLALQQWCRDMVGTVHTFQGKEQSAVLMVLGADQDNAGAAAWAAARPNLLNVALTRAQHHFYIVGEAALWSGLPFFEQVHAALPPITPQAFLAGALAPVSGAPG